MQNEEIVFDLAELQVDAPLRCDVFQLNGSLLAKEGQVVTAQTLRDWAARGIKKAKLLVADHAAAALAESTSDEVLANDVPEALMPYDTAALQRLEQAIDVSATRMLDVAESLESGQLSDCDAVADSIDGFVAEIELDIATVLYSIQTTGPEELSGADVELAKRCSKMSVLGIAIGATLEWPDEELQVIGMAGMLHDLSLFERTQEAVVAACGAQDDPRNRFREHPLQSASLLTYVSGMSTTKRNVIAQVHESPNGTGFPRGLESERINRAASVLGVVDAYLTLTAVAQSDCFPPAANLVPADALAYMLHHAAQGRFDTVAVRGLVTATSLYPVGSLVELDDQSTAVVLRSNASAPSSPIVRIDGTAGSIIDLNGADVAIVRPVPPPGSSFGRIRASQLPEILWRPA